VLVVGFDHRVGHVGPRSMTAEHCPWLFSLLVPLAHDSHMLRMIGTDDEERPEVWFVRVHAWSCDAASRTAARMAAATTAAG
jgi:hypothetical protein